MATKKPVAVTDTSVADATADTITAPDVYASAGETLTCPNGHVIGTFNQDIASGDPLQADAIDWKNHNASVPGSVVAPCFECGEHYLRVGDDGTAKAHIGEDWR